MLKWSIRSLELPLKYTWHISRNAVDSKTNLLVTVSDGHVSGTGEAAPNIRYGETPAGLTETFQSHRWPESPTTLADFDRALDEFLLPNALRFAIESAYVHFLAASNRVPVESILQMPSPRPAQTAYTIPILETGTMQDFYREHNLQRFRTIKLKVGREAPFEAVEELFSFCDRPAIIDANEAFVDADACIRWLEKIKHHSVVFVEQPLPAGRFEEDVIVKKRSPFPLVADESITSLPDFQVLSGGFHGVNMKLMKAGGYLRGANILQEAHRHGLFGMIGCMVETTLGISSALRLSSLARYIDLDSFLLLRDEPFGLVEEVNGELTLQTQRPLP